MKSLVVVEKMLEMSDAETKTFLGLDVIEGEVDGALFTGEGLVMDRVIELTRAYEEEVYMDYMNTRALTKSVSFLEGRIDLLLGELFDEIPMFALFRRGERMDRWFKEDMTEIVDLLSGDGVYVSVASDDEQGRVAFGSGEGDYYVLMSSVALGESSVDFNPRGYGFISVVESVPSADSGVKYSVVYAGEKAVAEKVKRVMFCVGKRAELKQGEYEDREEFLAKTLSYQKELSDVTGLDVLELTNRLKALG